MAEIEDGVNMQAVYSTYNTTRKTENRGIGVSFKKGDYMERSQKRSPYDTYEFKPSNSGGKKNKKKNEGGVFYIILTLLLLVVLYPVGLILLWQKKLNWPIATKLLMSVMTAILFCALLIVGMNYETGNATIGNIQKKVRSVFERVDYYTGDTVDAVAGWFTEQYETGKENTLKLWDTVDEKAAEAVLSAYGEIDDNLYAVKVQLPGTLLGMYKDKIGYEPKKEAVLSPEKQATPDSGMTVYVNTPSTPEEVTRPEATPVPAATPAPTFTPVPTATPEPIILPEIKDVSLAEVFFTNGGTYYHAKSNCSGMMNAASKTLLQAQEKGKKYCDVCGVTSFDMMDCENYLWVDTDRKAHTTDECRDFADGRYTVLPFDDVYNGSYQYCETCEADICYEYMRRNDSMYIVNSELMDEQLKELYDYERTITVYYGENSRQYHRIPECQYMTKDIYKHTLYQALHVDMKKLCTLCNPLTEEQAYEQLNSMKAGN